MRKRILSACFLVAAIVALPATSFAGSETDRTPVERLAPVESESNTEELYRGASRDEQVRAELSELAEVQAESDAEVIAAAGNAEVLVDPDGNILAARASEPTIAPFAIDWISIGCTPTSACVYTNYGRTPQGFSGTGQLTHTLSNVAKFFAGDRNTSLWRGNTALFAARNNTLYLTTATTFGSITRS